jgi:S1-C subfamily serine protease
MRRNVTKVMKGLVIALCTVAILGGARHGYLVLENYQAGRVEEHIKNAAVRIELCSNNRCGGGSGFVVKQNDNGAFIVTNKHVCEIAATKSDGVYEYVPVRIVKRNRSSGFGQIVKISSNADLCLIYTNLKFKNVLSLADDYQIGDFVQCYGFPEGKPLLLKGVLKGQGPKGYGMYSESNMLAWYGISGSAVVNKDGEVVGVMSNLMATDPRKRSTVFGSLFIPLEVLKEFLGGI